MNSRECEICNVDVHRASFAKHLRSKKHSENIKQNEVIIPEWLYKEHIENKIKKFSMIVFTYKTGEIDGRSYVKIPLRLNGILNIENEDKYVSFCQF